jgi:Head domain of trimeric autotransporter adhesin/Chaperone of endosialidase
MKNYIFLFFLFFGASVRIVSAQSIEIKPGSIFPKMTTVQRTNLNPALNGTLVFDTNLGTYWYRRNGLWTELPKNTGPANFWEIAGNAGNELKNTTPHGIWSANAVGLNASSSNVTNPPNVPFSGAGTRLMWIPSRSAFRVGSVGNLGFFVLGNQSTYWNADSVGLMSFASGLNTRAIGRTSTAMGMETIARGDAATAFGYYTEAQGNNSFAIGFKTKASGSTSTVMGYLTKASGNYSFAAGKETSATNENAFAFGNNTVANGQNSFAFGTNSRASGSYAMAFGISSLASGVNSIAIGKQDWAAGTRSIAIGDRAVSSGQSSIAIGSELNASGSNSIALGRGNKDNPNSLLMIGNYSLYKNAMVITQAGNVGMGVENPIAPLHVGTEQHLISAYFLDKLPNTTVWNYYVQNSTNMSINAQGAIYSDRFMTALQFNTSSDSRIKKDFSESNNDEDLKILKKIEIIDYTMKDTLSWGKKNFKKVIAQQIESIYPACVTNKTAIIPDIYASSKSLQYDPISRILHVELDKNYKIKVGDNIQFIHDINGKITSKVIEVSANSFKVENWPYSTDKIFVFGREIDDFKTVDYESLTILATSSIQTISKTNEINRKKTELLMLENEKSNANLNNLLTNIEAKLNLILKE